VKRVLIAPPLEEYLAAAETSIDRKFDDRRGRTAAQAHMDAVKLTEARNLLGGQSSSLLAEEAKIRGVEPDELARQVIGAAEASANLELDRVRLKQAVRAAKTHKEITRLLRDHGVPLTPGV
jgi:hypothetical protein